MSNLNLTSLDSSVNMDNIGNMLADGLYNMAGGARFVDDLGISNDAKKGASVGMFIFYIILSLTIISITGYQAFKSLPENEKGETKWKKWSKITLYVVIVIAWLATLYCGFSSRPRTEFWAKILVMLTGFLQLALMMWSRSGEALDDKEAFFYNCTLFLILLQVGVGAASVPSMSDTAADMGTNAPFGRFSRSAMGPMSSSSIPRTGTVSPASASLGSLSPVRPRSRSAQFGGDLFLKKY